MRRTLTALSFAAALSIACRGEAAGPPEARDLYRIEAVAAPASVQAGQQGTFRIAVRPTVAGAHVKPETPFRGTLGATGPVSIGKTQIGYADHARVENGGPVFEIPYTAEAAGSGTLTADLVFFVCTDEVCLRTTDKLSVPVQVN